MKILIVDDEPGIVNLIRMNLELERYEVVSAYSAAEALDVFAREKPNIVLLDFALPDMEGPELLEALKKLDNTVPVIMVTVRDKQHHKILSLQLGAEDYITKPFDLKELLLRIRVVERRLGRFDAPRETAPNPEGIVTAGPIRISPEQMRVWIDGQEIALTHKEFQILLLLSQGKHIVYSREKLLELVWGYDFLGNSRTVDILIGRLRKKLGPAGEMIKSIYGAGYRLDV